MRLSTDKDEEKVRQLRLEFRDFRNFWISVFCLEAVKEKKINIKKMEKKMRRGEMRLFIVFSEKYQFFHFTA